MKANSSLFRVILLLIALFAFTDALALTVNPSSATILVGKTANIAVTNISGSVTVSTSNSSVATVAYTTGVAVITGVNRGSTTIRVRDNNSSKSISVNVTKASQTISFGAAPSITINSTGSVSAIATSSLAVTFTSRTASVCSVSGSTVTGIALGTCTIAANQAGNTAYNAAPQVTQSFTISKNNQTITFGPVSGIFVGDTTSLSATSSSGLAIIYTNSTPTICTLTGTSVAGIAAGTCSISADQAGNGNYNAAVQVAQSFAVTKKSQALIFTPIASLLVGKTAILSASSESGLTATYSSNSPGICTVSGSIVTGVTEGTCTVSADQAGNAGFNAAPQASQNIAVSKQAQLLTFGSAPSIFVGETGSVTATSDSGLPVTFTSTSSSVCSVSGSTVTGLSAGTCNIASNQSGDVTFSAAAQVIQAINISKKSQTLTFGSLPSIFVGGTGSVIATSDSGLSTILTSTTPTVCTVSGSTVTGVIAGTCSIAANQAGNATYNVATQVIQTISVSPASQTLVFDPVPILFVGGTVTVSATGGKSSKSVIYTSTPASICTINGAVVTGVAVGACTITANQAADANYNAASPVTQLINVAAPPPMTVSPTAVTVTVGLTSSIVASNALGAVSVTSSSTSRATASVAGNIITVKGISTGSATLTIKDTKTTLTVPVTMQAAPSPPVAGNYTLLAWNDLGMHCMDGMDFSVFTILPPYNTLHAQLKDKLGKLITTNVKLTYEAVPDSAGSMNSSSYDKTNFWDNVGQLFGLNPAKDVGVNLDGLASGTPVPGSKVPSLIPTAMIYNADFKWFEAEGIPMTPFPDNPKFDSNNNPIKNFYPTVKVVARDLNNNLLAETTTVLPVSDEMTCKGCHASTTVSSAAKPSPDWVKDSNPDKDWKRNVLLLHDNKQLSSQLYKDALSKKAFNPSGLLATADGKQPVLCVTCHASNAYFDKLNKKTVMPGLPGIRPFTQVLHLKHAGVTDPATKLPLDTAGDRQACYNCHPGSVTQCLRGAMSTLKDTKTGDAAISCQSCHGNLAAVGSTARQGWFNEPTCEACHNSAVPGKRAISGVNATGIPTVPADHTFATNANAPVTGLNLYRFSTGHGGLQCEACHGATHAEYPSTHANDNIESIAVQGHAGTVAECTACHKTVPTTVNGGPHGMHTTGNAWVSSHQNANKNGTATTPSCAYCHGTTSAGTPLSAIKVAKTINAGEFGAKNWPAGYQVSCFSCHNGPNP